MNRIGLKISCLLAAVLIWVQVAATSVVEQTADLPLQLSGLATDLTVAGSDIPRKVPVRLRGAKLSLLTHTYFNRYVGEVRLSLADREAGPAFSYQLTEADVISDLEVVRMVADTRVRLRIDEAWTRRLPVVLRLRGEWPEGVGLLDTPWVDPDSVTVTGPSRFFTGLEAVRTEGIDRQRQDQTAALDLDLVPPHEHLRMAPERVVAHLGLAPLEERTLANVPVIPLVDAGWPEVGISPPVADMMVRGVADSVRALTVSRVAVTVAVGNRSEGIYVLPGRAEHPSWLTVLGLAPHEFRVIVGNPPLEGSGAVADTAGAIHE